MDFGWRPWRWTRERLTDRQFHYFKQVRALHLHVDLVEIDEIALQTHRLPSPASDRGGFTPFHAVLNTCPHVYANDHAHHACAIDSA